MPARDLLDRIFPVRNGGPGGRDITPAAAAAALLALSALFFSKVFTGDYGTHLAVGREIWRTGAIPSREFLNYPSLGVPQRLTEWAFQAFLWKVYEAGGTAAVSVMAWAAAAATLWLLYLAARARGAARWATVAALAALAGFLRIRVQPRPELFAYLFLSFTIFALSEHFFGKRKKLIFAIPPVMVAWVNVHASHLVGFAVIGAFFADRLVAAAAKRELSARALLSWAPAPAAAAAAALLCTWATPSGFSEILAPVGMSADRILGLSITEMAPVRATTFYPVFLGAAAFLAAAVAAGAWNRSVRLLDLLMIAAPLAGSWSAARGLAFICVMAAPGVAAILSSFGGRADGGGGAAAGAGSGFRRAAAWTLSAGALALGGWSAAASLTAVEYGIGFTAHKYSEAAVEFIRAADPPGNIFNFFDLGGFLDWRLYPKKRTFIDGRTYDYRLYMDYNTVVAAIRGWDAVLDRYGADVIVTSALDSSGTVLPLVQRLLQDRRFALVFSDGLALVFLKDTPGNAAIIAGHEIPKDRIYGQMIEEGRHGMHLGMSKTAAFVVIGSALASQGKYPEAAGAFREALSHGESDYARKALKMFDPGARQ